MRLFILDVVWDIEPETGYDRCSIRCNNKRFPGATGGGYDMIGTALGNWMERVLIDELRQRITKLHHGLTFHDPTVDVGQMPVTPDGQTVEERERAGKSVGLERMQKTYEAASNVPTVRHVVSITDGAYGVDAMIRILDTLGFTVETIHRRSKTKQFIVTETGKWKPDATNDNKTQ